MRTVVVRRGKAKALWMGHPWVFGPSVVEVRGHAEGPPDDVVEVVDEEGKPIGRGFLSEGSHIRVRLLDRGGAPVPEVLAARIHAATALRRLLFPDPARTSAYRVVHAEGDGLPGLVVDRVGDVLVAQFATAAMHRRREDLARLLLEATGARSLVARGAGYEDEEGIPDGDVAFAAGEAAPESVEVREEGMALVVEPRAGQKTGHYADQRENRVLVAGFARGGTLLDLYAGTGGFSVQALRQGATSAVAVESSARAADAAERHGGLNGVADRLEVRRQDVRHALDEAKAAGARFDVVVCDPPNLVPRRGDAGPAWKAYRELNVRALTRVKPGGVLATFTCSSLLDAPAFLDLVRSASRDCRRGVAVLRELTAGPDHPWVAPEGRYLSGYALRVGD